MKVKFWSFMKQGAEPLGVSAFLLGLLTLIVAVFLAIFTELAIEIVALMLGLFSVGLGFVAIDRSFKSDSAYTSLLEQLRQGVVNLPTLFKNDVL
jgi:hypothetical protein